MFNFLIAVELIISIMLIVAILLQSSKGGGLAGAFGGGSVGMVFGVRRTADFLTRATQWLAGIFIVLSLVINIWFLPRVGETATESVLQGGTAGQQTVPAVPQLPPQGPPTSAPQQGN